MRTKVACGLILVLIFVAGCTSTAGDSGRGAQLREPEYPAAQAWAVGDGTVSETEYRAAIDGFVSCMREAGYTIGDPVLSPIDGLTLLYDLIPSGNPDAWNKKVEECNRAHVSHIEPAYVEARAQTMAPPLRAATAKCLSAKGFTLRGTERNLADFAKATNNIGDALMDCLATTVPQVFPGLPSYLKIRY